MLYIFERHLVNNIQNDRIAAHVLHFRVFHRRQSDQKASCPVALNLKMRRKLRLFRLLSIWGMSPCYGWMVKKHGIKWRYSESLSTGVPPLTLLGSLWIPAPAGSPPSSPATVCLSPTSLPTFRICLLNQLSAVLTRCYPRKLTRFSPTQSRESALERLMKVLPVVFTSPTYLSSFVSPILLASSAHMALWLTHRWSPTRRAPKDLASSAWVIPKKQQWLEGCFMELL